MQRDAFFAAMLSEADALVRDGRGLAGISFWGWSGEGVPRSGAPATGKLGWHEGDTLMGDPPSEKQGTFAVFGSDASTCAVIKKYAGRINTTP